MYESDFVQILRQKPFQPFRIHVSDGTIYDINHPEFVLVSPSTAFVHFPSEDLPPPAVDTKYEIVSLSHITRIVPKESKSPTNGSSTN